MGVQAAWRHRISRPKRFTYRLGAPGLVCMMDYRSASIILFLCCYFWGTTIAAVGLAYQGLTKRSARR